MYVVGVSMLTPLGDSEKMTSAALDAGVSVVEASQFANKHFESIKMADVPEAALAPLAQSVLEAFPHISGREKRLLRLCDGALSAELRERLGDKPVTLFLAGPEQLFPHVAGAGMGPHFLEALSCQLDLAIDLQASRKFALGRAGVIAAIDHAFKYMAVTGVAQVLIGGVDTYRDHTVLASLDAQDRIAAQGVMNGFAPGEAAAFLLLSALPAGAEEKAPRLRLSNPGLGEEPGHWYSEEPYLGNGLADAVRIAVKTHQKPIQAVYSSMNFEHFWAKELGVALTRNASAMEEGYQIEHPADCFGDIGAAFTAVVIGVLTVKPPGSYLVYGSSDGAPRSAIGLEVF